MADNDDADNDSTQHFSVPPASAPSPGNGSGDGSDGGSGNGWIIANRYRVTGRIGAGGMAEVFRARDQLLDRDIAIKVFRSVATADTAAGVERQRAEIHALARLNHPNLITLYDGAVVASDDTQTPAYLVMELVEGPNLGDRIEQGPAPTEREVRAIGAQIADALGYVHAQGMVHRDVKPANILLGAGTGADQVRARLSDFGIVRLVGAERMTQADSTLGTASYLAPEQARGSAVGPAADVYALGLTLIEALTGVRSFDAPTPLEAVLARLDHDPAIPAGLPEPWPGLLTAMTARDPARRPNARQVANALRGGDTTELLAAAAPAGVTGSTTVIPAVAAPPPVSRPRDTDYRPVAAPVEERERRNTGLIVGIVLAAVLLLLGAIILIATTSGDDGSGGTTTPPSTAPASTTPSEAPQTQQSEQTQQPTDQQSQPSGGDETTPTPTRTRQSSSSSQQSTSSQSSTSASTSSRATSTTPTPPGAAAPGGPGNGGRGNGGPGNGGRGNGP